MLVHVACKANISGDEGVLTYRAPGAQIGQLVLVRLRGRRVPGIVIKTDVAAGTSQAILPVLAQSDKPLPTPFVKWLAAVANWYALPLSPTVAQLASNLNGRYVTDRSPQTEIGPQRLWLTPADTTPLGQYLATRAQGIPSGQTERRQQWQAAAAGAVLNIVGTSSAVSLPFRNLKEIVIETPLASPYYSDRSPGWHTAVLTALLAQAHEAKLTIRTSIPLTELRKRLPLPESATIQTPRYQPIEVIPQKDRGRLNADLVGTLKRALKDGRRILVYHNHLPGLAIDGRPIGLAQLATRLTAALDLPVGVVTAQAELPDTPVVVATATSLYRLTDHFDLIVVPDVDGLASANQPWSNLAALDTLGTLASRAPLIAQGRDLSAPLNQALLAQLEANRLADIAWPTFSSRLIRLRIKDEIALPPSWSVIHQNKAEIFALAPRQLTTLDRQFITTVRAHGHIWTDEWTWPPISDTVVQQ